MDLDSQITSLDVPQSNAQDHVDGGLVVNNSILPASCALCRRTLALDAEVFDNLETISVCGDCKFLLLEDLGTSPQDSHQRRPTRGRRTRYSSSESIDNLFSQQFSHIINLARQNQSTISGYQEQSLDGDAAATYSQHASSRTTPSDSRRWRRVLSDTESDGFDNLDSLYGESESNVSFSRYRLFHGEGDAISFSAYGGDSDASVDGYGLLDTEILAQPDERSDLDGDTDIDPMHAGLNQWDSDEPEEEEEEDGDWEEADIEEDTIEPTEDGAQHQNFFLSSPGESNSVANWRLQFHSPQFEGTFHRRMRRGRQTLPRGTFADFQASELQPYIGNSGDYLDARGFEELLEHLAETDGSRRGAPPAAVSLVNSLPCVIINEEHEKHDGLACAICKDVLTAGTEVNQLPCLHFYHPSCILPWLSARNSCPLCRYELPTDDKDYEEGRQHTRNRMEIHEIHQQDSSEDSSSEVSVEVEIHEAPEARERRLDHRELLEPDPATRSSGGEGSGRRWFFLAAAPIVSLVGIVLVLWLGNPCAEGRPGPGHCSILERGQHQINITGPSSVNQRGSRDRRWWSLF